MKWFKKKQYYVVGVGTNGMLENYSRACYLLQKN